MKKITFNVASIKAAAIAVQPVKAQKTVKADYVQPTFELPTDAPDLQKFPIFGTPIGAAYVQGDELVCKGLDALAAAWTTAHIGHSFGKPDERKRMAYTASFGALVYMAASGFTPSQHSKILKWWLTGHAIHHMKGLVRPSDAQTLAMMPVQLQDAFKAGLLIPCNVWQAAPTPDMFKQSLWLLHVPGVGSALDYLPELAARVTDDTPEAQDDTSKPATPAQAPTKASKPAKAGK